LYRIVDLHWAEVCNEISAIEELAETPGFPAADLAAALASKCFYHLQEYNESLRLALSAGPYFDIYNKNEYVETLLSKCIDEYTSLRKKQDTDPNLVIDPRMENIIEQMFLRCYRDLCFEQAIGIALDTRRIDKVEHTCLAAIAANKFHILGYTFNICQGARNVTSREFRLLVVAVLVKLYGKLPSPDYANMCSGYQHLNQPVEVVKILKQLCQGSLEQTLTAYQICFDMLETEDQGFVLKVTAALNATATAGEGAEEKSGEGVSTEESVDLVYSDRLKKINRILVENLDVDLNLNFLFRHNRSDVSILQGIKTATEGRAAVLHQATVVTHAYMNSGTTVDTFLRQNLEWLGKASNWAKFTAVASIGVVHKGHISESMNLLQPYLPRGGMSTSPYSESGALYALGLIHFNKGKEIVDGRIRIISCADNSD